MLASAWDYKVRQNVSILILLFLLIVSQYSCVGTIKDADAISTHTQDSKNTVVKVPFDGLYSAVPIANSKVELFFNPTPVDAAKIAYVIRYTGLQVPIYVAALALKQDYRGRLRYTVTGLQSDTSYSFSVQALNLSTGMESESTVAKQVKTFANNTANFMGVTELRHLQGAAGTRGISVFWNPAQVKGTIVTKDEIDPVEYRVSVIDGSELNPGNMNDDSFTIPKRRVLSVGADKRSLVVGGLNPERKYYVQVRAVHFGYLANSGDTSYLLEQNTTYNEITTYSDDVGTIDFDASTYSLNLPVGNDGYYSLITNWGTPTGNFDHYRLYYGVQGQADLTNYLNTQDGDATCADSESSNPNISCVLVEASKNSKLITGLNPNLTYDVAIVICASINCELSQRVFGGLLSKKTTPPVASFQGITSISPAKSLAELDKIYLNFSLPNFLSGGISGYLIRYFGSDPNSPAPIDINDPMVANSTGLSVSSYNVFTDTEIAISGVDPASNNSYCFLMIPFSYNNDGTKNLGDVSGAVPKCIVPALNGPSKLQFSGIKTVFCEPVTHSIQILWETPTQGIYSNYEVFYESSYGQFLFGDAIEYANNNYKRILISPTYNEYYLVGLPAPATYWVGVLTYYNSLNGPVRSEFNTNYFSCTFDY